MYNSFYYNKGNVSMCCLQNKLLRKTDWSDVNNLEEFYKNSEFQKIRSTLQSNIYPTECNTCWVMENQGTESMRQSNPYFMGIQDQTPRITHVDLRLSNKCNLACRMCFAGDSDQIAKLEGIEIQPSDTSKILDLVLDLPDLKNIRFAGGEPFVMPEVIDFLNKLVSIERTDIEIEIITNCTSIKSSLITTLNKFKKVVIMASIDGVGTWFEFQRYPARWKSVRRNFEQIYNSNSIVKMVPCIGSINLLGLSEFFIWANQCPNAQVTFNEIIEPAYLNFRYVPLDNRKRLWSEFKDMTLRNAVTDWTVFKEKLMYEYLEPDETVKQQIKDRNHLVWHANEEQMKEVFPWIYT